MSNQVVLVTGGLTGIGRAAAIAFTQTAQLERETRGLLGSVLPATAQLYAMWYRVGPPEERMRSAPGQDVIA